MTDQIVEVERENWTNLRNFFLKDWPNNVVGYYTIDNFIKWTEKEPNTKNLHIYSLNGDWTDGTFAVIDRYQLFINSLNESNERLFKLLQLLDWSHGFKVSTLLERHREPLLKTVELKKLSIEFDSQTFLYYMSKEDAAKLVVAVPDGFTLKALNESHAEIADQAWPNRHVGSLYFLKRLSRLNPNVGLFKKDGKLVAWSFRFQAGPLGALQVAEEFLGQGFGTLICKAITKKIGEMGEDVYACVGVENLPSIKTFERCGFKVIDYAYWFRTYPTVPFVWSDD